MEIKYHESVLIEYSYLLFPNNQTFRIITNKVEDFMQFHVENYKNSRIVVAMVSANLTGTASPIILYFCEMVPTNSQLSGNPCTLAYSLTVKGLSSSG